MNRKRGEKDGVAAYQFQSATVVKDRLYLVVTAVVVLAHTDPLYRHGDAAQGQLVCKTRHTHTHTLSRLSSSGIYMTKCSCLKDRKTFFGQEDT